MFFDIISSMNVRNVFLQCKYPADFPIQITIKTHNTFGPLTMNSFS